MGGIVVREIVINGNGKTQSLPRYDVAEVEEIPHSV